MREGKSEFIISVAMNCEWSTDVAAVSVCTLPWRGSIGGLRPLDLDHARAGVGEAAGAHGRRHRLLQRHHQQA
jgi:hypothetical protein